LSVAPDTVRFILTSVPSIPFLEALLLVRAVPSVAWQKDTLAHRLYLNPARAEQLLQQLAAAGMAEQQADGYRYAPRSSELRERVDELASAYSKYLIEVTQLIHSKSDRTAQQFADAFKWNKE
jgi:DNA-binding IclR family transcriptional regulator